MASFNKVLLMGVLTRDVDFRTTQSGKSVCSFTLAVKSINNSCYFASVTAWDKHAEFLRDYGRKGTLVLVDGCLIREQWTAKDGSQREKTVVNAFGVQVIKRDAPPQTSSNDRTMRPWETAPETHQDNYPIYTGSSGIDPDEFPF